MMVVFSILTLAEFGPNDHREDAPNFNRLKKNLRVIKEFYLEFLVENISIAEPDRQQQC